MRDANVFARPLSNVDPGGEAANEIFDDGKGASEIEGEMGVEESELYDCDLDVIGTIRLFSFPSDVLVWESFLESNWV